MDYQGELKAVQSWLKATAGLNSWRRSEAPPTLPRPVVVWDSPYRGRANNLHRYAYVQKVIYYGKLYVSSLNEVLDLQDTLITDLENKCGVIPINGSGGTPLGLLKDATLEFTETEGLDVPFRLTYYVTYGRIKPAAPPAPLKVFTRVDSDNTTL